MSKPSKSIMQTEKVCFITGSTYGLDRHHCFHGCRRAAAEKHGCWIWLRRDLHNGLHSWDTALDEYIKDLCQRRFEELYSHQEFMDIFGKSYLKEDDPDEADTEHESFAAYERAWLNYTK